MICNTKTCKTLIADCVSLLPTAYTCLADFFFLARVCRNMHGWGCRVGCAIPDGMVNNIHMSVGDAQQCSTPQKCKCV